MASLLEEFEIHHMGAPLFTIGGHPIAFTNSTLFMMLAIVASTALDGSGDAPASDDPRPLADAGGNRL